MNRMQVFNVLNKSKEGQISNQDLLTEQQVLQRLEENSKMETDDINAAIERMKQTTDVLFIDLSGGDQILFHGTEVLLH